VRFVPKYESGVDAHGRRRLPRAAPPLLAAVVLITIVAGLVMSYVEADQIEVVAFNRYALGMRSGFGSSMVILSCCNVDGSRISFSRLGRQVGADAFFSHDPGRSEAISHPPGGPFRVQTTYFRLFHVEVRAARNLFTFRDGGSRLGPIDSWMVSTSWWWPLVAAVMVNIATWRRLRRRCRYFPTL
jgi:hypothetical protein